MSHDPPVRGRRTSRWTARSSGATYVLRHPNHKARLTRPPAGYVPLFLLTSQMPLLYSYSAFFQLHCRTPHGLRRDPVARAVEAGRAEGAGGGAAPAPRAAPGIAAGAAHGMREGGLP